MKHSRVTLFLLLIIGILVSCVLLFEHVALHNGFQTEHTFCSISEIFDCNLVAQSEYAKFLGLPVAAYALFYYLLFYGLMVFVPSEQRKDSSYRNTIFSYAFLSLPVSAWLLYVSIAKLNAFCLYCLILDGVNVLLCLFAWLCRDKSFSLWQSLCSGVNEAVVFFRAAFTTEGLVAKLSLSAILLLAASVAFAPDFLLLKVFVEQRNQEQKTQLIAQTFSEWQNSAPVSIDTSGDFVYGPADAEVEILEFSDFECPFCKKTAPVLKKLVNDSQGKVKLVFKNYPLDKSCHPYLQNELHKHACRAALYARCAGELGGTEKFWQMHDALFLAPWMSEDKFQELATRFSVAGEAFDTCVQAEITRQRIVKDVEAGVALGVRGTPSIFVNKKRVSAPIPEVLEKIIQASKS